MIYQLQSLYFAFNRALRTVLDRARPAVGFAECGGARVSSQPTCTARSRGRSADVVPDA